MIRVEYTDQLDGVDARTPRFPLSTAMAMRLQGKRVPWEVLLASPSGLMLLSRPVRFTDGSSAMLLMAIGASEGRQIKG